MSCEEWPLSDPAALADTLDMAAALDAYIRRYSWRGYEEARLVATGAARDLGLRMMPPAIAPDAEAPPPRDARRRPYDTPLSGLDGEAS